MSITSAAKVIGPATQTVTAKIERESLRMVEISREMRFADSSNAVCMPSARFEAHSPPLSDSLQVVSSYGRFLTRPKNSSIKNGLQIPQRFAGLLHGIVVFHLRPLQNEDRGGQVIRTPFRAYMLVVLKGGDRELEMVSVDAVF